MSVQGQKPGGGERPDPFQRQETHDYPEPPAHEIAAGEALICVAHPHPGAHLDESADHDGVTLDL